MGALKYLWLSETVDLYAKYLIYMAVPLHPLLRRCKSWTITKTSLKKLKSIPHEKSTEIITN